MLTFIIIGLITKKMVHEMNTIQLQFKNKQVKYSIFVEHSEK
jgi:hypothetical protein